MRTQHYLQSILEVSSGESRDGEWLLEDGVTVSSDIVPAWLLLIYNNIEKYHTLEAWFLWRISDHDKLSSLRLQIQPLLYMSTDIYDLLLLSQKQNKHLIIFIRTMTAPLSVILIRLGKSHFNIWGREEDREPKSQSQQYYLSDKDNLIATK